MRDNKNIIRVIMAICVCACQKNETTVDLKVSAKTNQGDPVAGAAVVLEKNEIGETDAQGLFEKTQTLSSDSRASIEIKKESPSYYFAPYFESFKVSNEESQKVTIVATLYFVPKPKEVPSGAEVKTKEEPVDSRISQSDLEKTAMEQPKAKRPNGSNPADVAADANAESQQKDEEVVLDGDFQKPKDAEIDAESLKAAKEDDAESSPSFVGKVKTDPELGSGYEGEEEATVESTSLTEILEAKGEAYPERVASNKGKVLYTVHIHHGKNPLPHADIFIGSPDQGDLKKACRTNTRGRCALRFLNLPQNPIALMIKKRGFQTTQKTVTVRHRGQLRVGLIPGKTIDVFAVRKSYNFTSGVDNVEVLINGKVVGITDRYGYFSFGYGGRPDDLISISLKSKENLPELFETDFVASGSMTLVKYFTPLKPVSAKLSITRLKPAGPVDSKNRNFFDGRFDRKLRAAAQKHVFSSTAFREFSPSLFRQAIKTSGLSLGAVTARGWQATDLKSKVDALVLPTLILKPKPILEMSFVDSTGRVIAAAKEPVDNPMDDHSIDRAVGTIAAKISRVFPFEGAVLRKEGEKIAINLGYGTGRSVEVNDVLDIYGIVTAKDGRNQTHGKIGQIRIAEVFDQYSNGIPFGMKPRAIIERGDLVVAHPKRDSSPESVSVTVREETSGINLSQANIYFNDMWIGSTNKGGRIESNISGTGQLKVVRHGFRPFTQRVDLTKKRRLKISLTKDMAFMRLESVPSGATITIDGKPVGKTPRTAPLAVQAGFIKLTLDGVAGYKPYNQVLELEHGTLDLSGVNSVSLEEDFIEQSEKLVKAGRIEQALQRLNDIPTNHSDYLWGRHRAGEIQLMITGDPAAAAKAFGIVTKDHSVAAFNDKRFIGSHINEGIALYLSGEGLRQQSKDLAVAHFVKSVEVLDRVAPHLRFVPADQYAQAVHNVDFYRALAKHRIWTDSQNSALLPTVLKAWEAYLEGSAQTVKAPTDSKNLLENARVYYKQALASRNAQQSSKSTMR
jgi:hypothetical protein